MTHDASSTGDRPTADRPDGDAPLAVRPRRPDDLPALLVLLQRVHEQEGYPVTSSAVDADWLAPPSELLGAVAVDNDRVVGHVALHAVGNPSNPTALLQWQQATARSADGLAVLSRFFTDRSVPGIGTALLAHAVQRADDLGRVPVLQVDPDSPARGFYRRRGWREVGSAVQQWGHRTVEAVLMVPAADIVTPSPLSERARTVDR